jgi:peptidoglycan/LPS O-acetylase OafA/YrhL
MGWGVSLFLVISGFIITITLLREIGRSGTVSIRGFHFRRAIRLLPVYAAYLIVVLCFSGANLTHVSRLDWAACLTATVNYLQEPGEAVGHLWSLSLQEQFYLLWPPLLIWLGVHRSRRVLIGCIVAAPVLRLLIYKLSTGTIETSWLTVTRIDNIAIGCLLALCVQEERFRVRTRALFHSSGKVTALALAGIAASWFLSRTSFRYDLTLHQSVLAAFWAVVLLACVCGQDSWIHRVTEARFVMVLGAASFSIYVWQQLFLWNHVVHWFDVWPTNILMTALVAAASYTFIEVPLVRLRHSGRNTAKTPEPAIVSANLIGARR